MHQLLMHLKQAMVQLLKVAKRYRPLYGGRGGGDGGYKLVPSIKRMSVEFCDFAELYLFLTNNSQTWQFYYF